MSISLLSEERKGNLCHMFEFLRKLSKQRVTSRSFTVWKWEATCPTSLSQVRMHDLLVPCCSFSTCKETPHGDGLDIPNTPQSWTQWSQFCFPHQNRQKEQHWLLLLVPYMPPSWSGSCTTCVHVVLTSEHWSAPRELPTLTLYNPNH